MQTARSQEKCLSEFAKELQRENDRDENRFQRIDDIIHQYELQAKKSEELLRNKRTLKKALIGNTDDTLEDQKKIIIDQLVSEPENESQENTSEYSIKHTPINKNDSSEKQLNNTNYISTEIKTDLIINKRSSSNTSTNKKRVESPLRVSENNLIDIDLFNARKQELSRRVNLYTEQKNSAATYERLYAIAMEKNTKEKLKRIEKRPKANLIKGIPNATALEVLLNKRFRFCTTNILKRKNVQSRLG